MTTLAARPLPRGTKLKVWLAYSLAALALVSAAGALGTLLVGETSHAAIWFSAGLAFVLQVIAFGALLMSREQAQTFLLSWLIGMALRFGALGVVAWWLSRSAALPREAALLSLVAFVFLLLLLEPVFLRWDLRKT